MLVTQVLMMETPLCQRGRKGLERQPSLGFKPAFDAMMCTFDYGRCDSLWPNVGQLGWLQGVPKCQNLVWLGLAALERLWHLLPCQVEVLNAEQSLPGWLMQF